MQSVFFCDNFLSRIVGITVWKEGCQKKRISELASASDEAFAYLLVENYWEYWSNLDTKDYKSEVAFDKESNKRIKRSRGHLPGANIPKVLMEQEGMVVGRLVACSDLMSYMKKS